MTRIVIVHGPMACGKTRNKDALMRALKCDHVVDGWEGWDRPDVPRHVSGCLVLTANPRPLAPTGGEVLTFGEAMRLAGLDN